jgi:hypothetical protein
LCSSEATSCGPTASEAASSIWKAASLSFRSPSLQQQRQKQQWQSSTSVIAIAALQMSVQQHLEGASVSFRSASLQQQEQQHP